MSADRRRVVYLRAEELVERFRGNGLDVKRAHALVRSRKLPGVRLHKNGARVVELSVAKSFFREAGLV